MAFNSFNKRSLGGGIKYADASIPNHEFANELQNRIDRIFKRIYSSLMDNMWGAYLADIQLKIRCNKRILSLFCVVFLGNKLGLFH